MALRRDWRLFALTWLTLPLALVAVALIGAVMMFVLGANPIDGYGALVHGAFGSGLSARQYRRQGRPAPACRGWHLHRLPGEHVQHRRRGPDRDRGAGERHRCTRASRSPGPCPDSTGSARRRCRRGRVGRDPGRLQSLLPGQRDPEHHHAQPRRRAAHELPPGRTAHRQGGRRRGRAHPADCASPPTVSIIIGGRQLHLGVPIALLAAVGVYVLLWRTSLGYRIRAVGLSVEAAQYAGMPVKRTMTLAMTLSGAMCGLAGALLVFGSVSHRAGDRRQPDRVHRLGRLQRHRCRACSAA